MSDDFVKNFIEGNNSPRPILPPRLESPEGKKNQEKFFEEINKVGRNLGFLEIDDMQGMVSMALVTSYIAHHGTADERKRFSSIMNYFVSGFPELESYMEKIILLTMYCSARNGAVTLNDVFKLIPEIDPEILSRQDTKKEIIEEFVKKANSPT